MVLGCDKDSWLSRAMIGFGFVWFSFCVVEFLLCVLIVVPTCNDLVD